MSYQIKNCKTFYVKVYPNGQILKVSSSKVTQLSFNERMSAVTLNNGAVKLCSETGHIMPFGKSPHYAKALQRSKEILKTLKERDKIFEEYISKEFFKKTKGSLIKTSDYPKIKEYLSLYKDGSCTEIGEYALIPLNVNELRSFYYVVNFSDNEKLEFVKNVLSDKNPSLVTPRGIKIWEMPSHSLRAIKYPDGSLGIARKEPMSLNALDAQIWAGCYLLSDGGQIPYWNKVLREELDLAGVKDSQNASNKKEYLEMAEICRNIFHSRNGEWAYYGAAWYVGGGFKDWN